MSKKLKMIFMGAGVVTAIVLLMVTFAQGTSVYSGRAKSPARASTAKQNAKQLASIQDPGNEQAVREDDKGNIVNPSQPADAKPSIVQGEVVVKIKDGSSINSIKTENASFAIKSIEKVFKDKPDPQEVLSDLDGQIAQLRSQEQASSESAFANLSIETQYRALLDTQIQQLTIARQAEQDLVNRLAERRRSAMNDIAAPKIDNIYIIKAENTKTDAITMAETYKSNPNVEYAEPNYYVETQMVPNDPYWTSSNSWGQGYDDLWGLKKIQVESAWDQTQGQSIITAVVDTGVDRSHEDLAVNMWVNTAEIPGNLIDDDQNGYVDDYYGWDFIGASAYSPASDNDPADAYGHGTHVAGTIAAVGNNSKGIIGVAPRARIMAVRALDNYGRGSATSCSAALIYAADMGARVINNSWGGSGNPSYIKDAVAYAYSEGCVIVASAGNSSADAAYFYPANMGKVITVAASSPYDSKCSFSNFGPKIDIAAPGGGLNGEYSVLSLLSTTHTAQLDDYKVGTSYLRLAGTSMAAPHAAGLAALIIAKNPGYTAEQVRYVLRNTADDIADSGWDTKTGFGRINAYQALMFSQTPPKLFGEITAPSVELPAPDNYYNNGSITIKGSAVGDDFASYTLSYAALGSNEYVPISSNSTMVTNGVLGVFDASGLSNGRYVIKLTIASIAGTTSETRTSVMIDNSLKMGWPKLVSSFQGWPGSWRSVGDVYNKSVCLADINCDGIKETLTSEGNRIYAWSKDGEAVPGFPIHIPGIDEDEGIMTSLSIANIDNDAAPEIVVGTADASLRPVHAFKNNGQPVAGFPAGNPGGIPGYVSQLGVPFPPVITDLDADGQNEISALVVTYNTNFPRIYMIVLNGDGTMREGWPKVISEDESAHFADENVSPLAAADMDSDGQKEIILGSTQSGSAYINMYSADGQQKSQTLVAANAKMLSQDMSSLILGDCDNDGELEMLIGVYRTDILTRSLYVLEGNGQIKTGWPNQVECNSYAFTNIEGGSGLNIIALGGAFGGTMYTFRSDGTMVPGWPKNLGIYYGEGMGSSLSYAPVFGRVAGSSGAATFANTYSGAVFGYDSNGSWLNNWPKNIAPAAGAEAIADLENDGKVEIGVHSFSGMVYQFEENAPGGAEVPSGWSTISGNNQRTGVCNPNPTPPVPSTPIGPSAGDRDIPFSFTASSAGASAAALTYTFDWGDGTLTTTPATPPGEIVTATHSWTIGGTFQVKVIAVDDFGGESRWSAATEIHITNMAPSTPAAPAGPTSVLNSEYGSYSTSATDPDGEKIKYTFDWGNGTTSVTDYTNSGLTAVYSHRWITPGNYAVKVMATDASGASSVWSGPLNVSVSDAPPQTPEFLMGPSDLNKNITGFFYMTTQDYSGRDVQLVYDWGDGTTTTSRWYSWFEYMDYYMGNLLSLHAWTTSGTYQVKVKAVNSIGSESSWSVPMTINISLPSQPGTLIGNAIVNQGTPNTYSGVTTDPDGDQLTYTFDWGDGTQYVTPSYPSGTSAPAFHAWVSTGLKSVQVKATDSDGAVSAWSSPFVVNVIGPAAPATPAKPTGAGTPSIVDSPSYTTSTTDANGDQIKYTYDWGDGTTTITEFFTSGSAAAGTHRWAAPGVYLVKTRATDTTGLASDWSPVLTVTVTTLPSQPPTIYLSPSSVVKKTAVMFYIHGYDNGSLPLQFIYDWADGTTTTTRWYSYTEYTSGMSCYAYHSWAVSGSYNVRVKAVNSDGLETQWSTPKNIVVTNAAPNTPSITQGTATGNRTVSYLYKAAGSDPNVDAIGYTFDWGDGTTTDVAPVASGVSVTATHAWQNLGTYSVRVKTTDSEGLVSAWSSPYTVSIVNAPPVAPPAVVGSANGFAKCAYSYSASTTDTDGDTVKYTFDWGDGTTSDTALIASGETASAAHTWNAIGTYQVKVKATDVFGLVSSWSPALTVAITQLPVPVPNVPTGPETVNKGVSTTYDVTDNSGPIVEPVKFVFDWGDNTTTTTRYFTPTEIADLVPVTASHAWTGYGTFSVKVKAVIENGTESVLSAPLGVTVVNRVPAAPPAVVGSSSGFAKLAATFSATAIDPDGDKVNYTFDWGDSTTVDTALVASGTAGEAAHTYDATGTYSIKVRATDEAGLISEWSPPFTVTAAQAPVPAPSTPIGPTSVGRQASATYSTTDVGGLAVEPIQFVFDWGDGTTTTTKFFTPIEMANLTPITASHAWSASGTFPVKVKGVIANGTTSAWSTACSVTVLNAAPETPPMVSGSAAGIINIANNYTAFTTDTNGDRVKYTFDWGDGTTTTTALVASGQIVTAGHAWTIVGTYQVKVMATDEFGATSVWSPAKSITVVSSLIQETGATYYKTWSSVANASASGGTYRTSSVKTGYAQLSFTGTGVTFISYKGPDQGKAGIYIDGVLKTTVDLYAATAVWQANVYTISGLTTGTHTIKVLVTGTKNSASKGTNVRVDAFDVRS